MCGKESLEELQESCRAMRCSVAALCAWVKRDNTVRITALGGNQGPHKLQGRRQFHTNQGEPNLCGASQKQAAVISRHLGQGFIHRSISGHLGHDFIHRSTKKII